jgi:hypothetical protein
VIPYIRDDGGVQSNIERAGRECRIYLTQRRQVRAAARAHAEMFVNGGAKRRAEIVVVNQPIVE